MRTAERCGRPTGEDPAFPHFTGICTRDPDHDGDCDNRIYSPAQDA